MDAQQEQQFSHDMRELARQYADGRFNKEEYRHRRRELIGRCTGDILEVDPEPTLNARPVEPASQEKAVQLLRIVAMTSVGLMLVMAGIILYLR